MVRTLDIMGHLCSIVAGTGVHVGIGNVAHGEVIPATGGGDQPPGVPGHHVPGHLASQHVTHVSLYNSGVTPRLCQTGPRPH